MNKILFDLGPYGVSVWNILIVAIIIISSIILQRVIHRSLKRYLINQNIRVEGRRVTLLRIFSQTIYIIALYLVLLSFKLNNPDVTFYDFFNYYIVPPNENQIILKHGLRFFDIISLIAIVLIARICVYVVKLLISQRLSRRKDYDPGSEYVYVQISKYIIYIIAVFFVLDVLHAKLQNILLGGAGIFIGVGLALQDVLKDFFSGIVLLIEGNLKVGDVIEITNTGDKEIIVAKILKVTVRTTQIETRNGNVLIIPNSRLTKENIENWSHGSELSRFIVNVSIAYGSNTEEVARLLKQAALSHPKVKKSQEVLVRMKHFGDNGLEMELLFWADQSWEILNTMSEIRLEIDRLFREYDISIPFPQRDLHVIDGDL